ncbi:hypothetical protein HG263_03530 [Pseudoalteromonas sp. JBTF-M23]|uniref:Uncharacterized protein n=1 Tax=Pseudoalteromonas caenipelagi TaxID=2726988 RepID=A0A849VAG2_9GAMM|nr:hypothetical protein [Pseudoalteromonas caenipelagi]NOU49613.1 hypothetical protein [Pseudoalteromonas caenipelagi]
MRLQLKKQKLKKLNNQEALIIDMKATKQVGGGANTLTGCAGLTCVKHM